MKPTVSRTEFKNHTGNDKTSFKKKIGCPTGTVPILRNTKEFTTNSQHFANKFLHPLSADSPGTHIAGVRSRNGPFHGVEALFDGHNLNVTKEQASYKQIYIGSGLTKQVNFISAGMMINPGFFSDERVWSYGFFKGINGNGCYNTACSGFVQVSSVVPIVEPADFSPGKPNWMHISIHEDKNTRNWWLTQVNRHGPNTYIGYWPKEMFNLFDNGANMVGVGGVVQASHSGSSPPMGDGNYPARNFRKSSSFRNIKVLDSNYEQCKMNDFSIENLLDSPRYYGLRIGKNPQLFRDKIGVFFNYGGPGGNSCEV